ncbi:MAG: acylphosphatase [Candidatus Woesearchaeota archaeon]
MKQVKVIISGVVQGVFFRSFVKDTANNLGLKGWVRNTEDGKVEAVFQGEEKNIEKIILYCHQDPPPSHVKDIKVIEEKPDNSLTRFKIKY